MGNKELKKFDDSDKSLIDYCNQIQVYLENGKKISNEMLATSIEQLTNELRKLNQNDNNQLRAKLLLKITAQLTPWCSEENVIDKMIKNELFCTYKKMITYYTDQPNWNIECLVYIFCALGTLTEMFETVVVENLHHDLIKCALKVFKDGDFLSKNNLENNLFELYLKNLVFITNNATYKRLTNEYLRRENAIDLFTDHLNKLNQLATDRKEINYVKCYLTMALVLILKDDEIDSLNITDEMLTNLVDGLKETIQKSKSNETVAGTKYYTIFTIDKIHITATLASEWLLRVLKVSISDKNKEKLFKMNVLDVVVEFLKKGNDLEKERTYELLCQLCFNKDVRKYLKENGEIMKLIDECEKNNRNMKETCQQIKDMVYEKLEKRIPFVINNKNSGHVMISYNHKYQEKCKEINEELKKAGLKTWLDVEATFTDLKDAMAKAVEDAAVILICYSIEYKESTNCRYEAEYASKLKKNMIFIKMQPDYEPDGWLGLILSTKLYVDFSVNNNSESYKLLLKQINSILNGNEDSTLNNANSNNSQINTQKSQQSIKTWTNDQVKSWLCSNNLSNLANVFDKYTGTTLKVLWEFKQKSFESFLKTIDNDIAKSGITVETHEKFAFIESLNDLFTD